MAISAVANKSVLIGGSVLLALALATGGGIYYVSNNKQEISAADYQELSKRDNAKKVSISGTIEAQSSVALTTNLAAPVNKVSVKVGDRVQVDQILARMDTSQIERQLATAQAQQAAQDAASISQIQAAQRQYDQLVGLNNDGLNGEISAAQAALRQADAQYQRAQAEYDFQRSQVDRGNDPSIIGQTAAVEAARDQVLNSALEAARTSTTIFYRAEDQARDTADLAALNTKLAQLISQRGLATDPTEIARLDADIASTQALVKALQEKLKRYPENYVGAGLTTASNAAGLLASLRNLNDAQNLLNNTLGGVDLKLQNAQRELALAFDAKKDAATNVIAAQRSVDNQVQNQQAAIDDAMRSARASRAANGASNQQLQVDIASAEVRSPISGIITRVDAKEGTPATGPLMMVADDRRLIIHSTIKEIDISKVKVGQEVDFTTTATENKKFEGRVSFISPAASTDGSTAMNPQAAGSGQTSSSKPTFPIEIEVIGDRDGLLLGSSVKAKIITEKASDNPLVSKDSVFKGPDGNFVLVVAKEDGTDIIRKRRIDLGKELDFDYEVTGGEVKTGDRILGDYQRFITDVDDEVEVAEDPAAAPSTTAQSGDDVAVEKVN
ncbi:efflux RND transporter periplasmic adaptor subunit [Corynebacterium sp. ES2715-CONJ3]|uniref:efflux RND transporter periplasmic adaptor subunit n=1 Tax=Corynebacterium sp. ES2715-CONJ3 TaxID=2974028 RepID=UPI00216A1C04|nr:efflux RND transporter periplasmic adaptor subunit [Corynebacterium sp. ES2715-CONJ3]MCS4491374.1 efflux RND transporter periplasmic adaptor subunit [Corynebacterium sp. ES2715-CONJ3]